MLSIHSTYGLLTLALAFLLSCLGAFLGLRCTARARSVTGSARTRWLLTGGVAIGALGIWTMHFVAMLGVTIPGASIRYNVPVTIASLVAVVVIVCAALLVVGSGRQRAGSLLSGGVITGLGVTAMHYLGLAAMQMPGRMTYDPLLLAGSAVIAVVAATAALWAAVRLDRIGPTLGASVIMALAISGMHVAGMGAMQMGPGQGNSGMMMSGGGASATSFLLPLIFGIVIVSFVMTAGIMLTPDPAEARRHAQLMRHIEQSQGSAGDSQPPAWMSRR